MGRQCREQKQACHPKEVDSAAWQTEAESEMQIGQKAVVRNTEGRNDKMPKELAEAWAA